MRKGAVGRGDPQFGVVPPIKRVGRVSTLRDGETLHAGTVAITAHLTPGHTPGGTSWTWNSCEAGRCVNMVYADSLTAVSADGFKFSASKEYPNAIADFEKSFAFFNATACDILLTPHPDTSDLWARLDDRRKLVDTTACRRLGERAREQLRTRLATEGQ